NPTMPQRTNNATHITPWAGMAPSPNAENEGNTRSGCLLSRCPMAADIDDAPNPEGQPRRDRQRTSLTSRRCPGETHGKPIAPLSIAGRGHGDGNAGRMHHHVHCGVIAEGARREVA